MRSACRNLDSQHRLLSHLHFIKPLKHRHRINLFRSRNKFLHCHFLQLIKVVKFLEVLILLIAIFLNFFFHLKLDLVHLQQFLCSSRTISPYDSEVWGVMLGSEKFPTTNSGQDAYDVEMATMRRVIDSEIHGEIPIEAYNSLFLVRVFSKHFIGNLSRDEINQQFEGDHTILADTPKFNGVESKIDENNRVQIDLNPKKLIIDPEVIQDTRSKAEQLMDGLLKVILKLDPILNGSTYEYYQECLNILLVLLSTQIHQPNASQLENNYFLNILLTNFGDFVNSLTKRLVTNFIEQKPSPPASTSMNLFNKNSFYFF
ncbi:hypothetical protein GLOIN_2v79970 [Rhizophagus irregularis DAOM 181602=DAOM 197198]|uniref:Dymeclin n=1 Tax=Rhizophagus irregularis (strain DAOM 181602 / DAOM 197198 / MUCL 43194) TaxID=747089 RepID=A0A2P4Q0N6_RHIID|nr:hypothetical protein GLOIN_2v79970 [Rhizophagus irregularis DAOM 181602=DAOM 197198]POG71184.1 hypothetical protein GLOIN_2v79970 [Rhizophagus irregularis DAOM 181602=DAOM 197198]|eukprot:XP_025178050.1 hypothetical protein GLOIN_2v79970 [Rhizophagus irregularis DAOM 181602=DAOM 197198]